MNSFRKLINKVLGVSICPHCDFVLGQKACALVCPQCNKPIVRNHPPTDVTKRWL